VYVNRFRATTALFAIAFSAALSAAAPSAADVPSGAYLAARSAAVNGDFEAAARHYTAALARDPSNPDILENASIALLALGDVDRASVVAAQLEDLDLRSQVAHMITAAKLTKEENYDEVLTRVSADRGIGPLVDGLLRSWSLVGTGDMSAALDSFDAVGEERGLQGFALYHKALALALVGDLEGADTIFGNHGRGCARRDCGSLLHRRKCFAQ